MSMFVALVAMAMSAQDSIPSQAIVERAVERLDMRSFPNSKRPWLNGAPARVRTLRQTGPQRFRWANGGLDVWEADGSWVRSFRPLASRRGSIRLCFVDRARNGGSYLARQALELRPAPGGLYRAREIEDPGCSGIPEE